MRGSSFERKFLRLRLAPVGRAKGVSPSGPPKLLPSLELLEVELVLEELDKVARAGDRWGATEEDEVAVEEEVMVGGGEEHWMTLPPPLPPPPPPTPPRPRKLLSLASSERVRGRKRVLEEEEEEDDSDGEMKEGSAAQP